MNTILKNRSPTPATQQEASKKWIRNTYFWPDIDPIRIYELMQATHVKHVPTEPAFRNAIMTGISETNATLYDYRQRQIAAGYPSLNCVPALQLDGESEKCFHYHRAVAALASANLVKHIVDKTNSPVAANTHRAIADLGRDAQWSVRLIRAHQRCRTEGF
ncbi:MAG: head completion/stabilization protein [Enterobacterales bacterium]|nr:head completion/stabilization protein [Enterobacterales bacterium]MDN6681633.1 head completion/stabilization protein [Enterobacterales bacterium]